jgi:hypothetical protein
LIAALAILAAVQAASPDTIIVRPLAATAPPTLTDDPAVLGQPQVQFETKQGWVNVWLFRWLDTVFVRATIPDSTPYWGDDFVLSLDTRGDAASTPQHDDFQWYFRRLLDSSVVYRGRNGRWQPPRDDPDWRLGTERSGGGWQVDAAAGPTGWTLLLRLEPGWLTGEAGSLPGVAFRTYDDAPAGWFSWPVPAPPLPPTIVEQSPAHWAPLRVR